jgi:hypothetical protein
MKLKCVKDEQGWWTEGEVYDAERMATGLVSVADDDDPDAEWQLAEQHNGENVVYFLLGSAGDVEFVEVPEGV